ncbi:hypothetical protein KIL84_000588 [Mauremys mutica]|uniref:Uncharacterized protein n=1 Tax=Mauremys mutica TaxID=74926 RepID=A0A9D4ASW1_9SAUR|nr:hypothetical protein KIL84_000588 [Mauremys mutica]
MEGPVPLPMIIALITAHVLRHSQEKTAKLGSVLMKVAMSSLTLAKVGQESTKE